MVTFSRGKFQRNFYGKSIFCICYGKPVLRMKKCLFLLLILHNCTSNLFSQTKRPPVIDMHVHAERVKKPKGGSPSIGAPFRELGINDPVNDYSQVFDSALKTNSWADQYLSSPGTSDSLRLLTISAMKRNNVYGVTSGDVETVRQWKKESPDRIIPAIHWDFNSVLHDGLTVDSLEKLFRSGEFKVFGEITIQYEGYSPSDSLFDPYLAMAERLDIPVGIHIGCGAPGAPYLGTPVTGRDCIVLWDWKKRCYGILN